MAGQSSTNVNGVIPVKMAKASTWEMAWSSPTNGGRFAAVSADFSGPTEYLSPRGFATR